MEIEKDLSKTFEMKKIGKIIFTFVINGLGAPFVDRCVGQTGDGKRWQGWAIQINPFRFNKYGDREIGKCLVVGFIS